MYSLIKKGILESLGERHPGGVFNGRKKEARAPFKGSFKAFHRGSIRSSGSGFRIRLSDSRLTCGDPAAQRCKNPSSDTLDPCNLAALNPCGQLPSHPPKDLNIPWIHSPPLSKDLYCNL